jgi:hypothetical protein
MTFTPYAYPVATPRRDDQSAVAPAQQTTQSNAIAACVIPVGAESEIGDMLNPTAIVQRDIFLLHPSENSFQRMLISVTQDTTPTFLSVQLVQRQGQQEVPLTAERVYRALRVAPEVVEDATPWGEGPVFLRLRATYSGARLLVTVEALTNEVL